MIKSEAKTVFYKWLMQPACERNPPTKNMLRAIIGVSKPTLSIWEKEFAYNRQQTDALRLRELEDKLYQLALEGKVNAAELYAKIKGILVDKSETKVSLELSADQLDKARRGAEERVREQVTRINAGVACVPDESPVLLQ